MTTSDEPIAVRARRFIEQHCIAHEELAERSDGKLPPAIRRQIAQAGITAGLVGPEHKLEHGGLQLSLGDQVLLHEVYGRVTNGIWWHVPTGANVLGHGTSEQIDRYLRPALRGDRIECYCITEEHAGSDPSSIRGTATGAGDLWKIETEKWFSTGGDEADFFIVHVNALGDDNAGLGPTLFLIDRDTPGVRIVDNPPHTHNFPFGHPVVRFDCTVPDSQRLGPIGAGGTLTNEWFVEERVHIAARCVGAMERLIEIGTAWAIEREQFESRLIDFQGVSFPLADSAAEALCAKLLTRHVAELADSGADAKLVHAKASMAKLYASEAAGRVADRVVQILGGRGYQRTHAVERLWRELRVDRIWEGTSEIQRLIVARGLERRGVAEILEVP